MKNTKRMSPTRSLSVVGIILIVIFLPIVILNLTIIIKGWINPEKVPMVFNRAPLIVVSDSMTIEKDSEGKIISGAFNKNDLIFVKGINNASSLAVGDIITFRYSDGSIVTHRIMNIYDDGTYETKGDYNAGYDPDPVKIEQIQGIYTGYRIPGIGKVVLFMQSIPGILLLIGLPLAIILVLLIIDNSKGKKLSLGQQAKLEEELRILRAQMKNNENLTSLDEENSEIEGEQEK